MNKYRLILSKKPVTGDTLRIDGKVFTFTENQNYLEIEFEAENATETLTNASSYIKQIT